MKKNEKETEKEEKPRVTRDAIGLQKMKLEKLMKNPEKPVIIPERQKDKKLPHVPDFVRNVMGSSAGAGSGEFHVYRHLRRKEYARQKIIHEKSEKAKLDEEYQRKLEENRKAAEERTAKKRAKRLKRKEKLKKKKFEGNAKNNMKEENSNEESDDGETDGKERSEDMSDQDKTSSDENASNDRHYKKETEGDGSDKMIVKEEESVEKSNGDSISSEGTAE